MQSLLSNEGVTSGANAPPTFVSLTENVPPTDVSLTENTPPSYVSLTENVPPTDVSLTENTPPTYVSLTEMWRRPRVLVFFFFLSLAYDDQRGPSGEREFTHRE